MNLANFSGREVSLTKDLLHVQEINFEAHFCGGALKPEQRFPPKHVQLLEKKLGITPVQTAENCCLETFL